MPEPRPVETSAPARDRVPATPPDGGVATVLARPPAAAGELAPGAVARLVHQIWRSFASGILVLDGEGPARRLCFLRGLPVAFAGDDPADGIEGWLAAAGRLDPAARQAAAEARGTGLTPGAALVAAGVLEPGEPLEAAHRAHLRAMLVRAAGAHAGRWRFHPGDEFAAELHTAEVAPLPALVEGIRAHLPAKLFADGLKPVLDAYPVGTGELPRLLGSGALGAGDARLCDGLDGATSTRAFLGARKAELREALSLLWFLSLAGAIAFAEAPAAPPPRRTPSQTRPPPPPELAEDLRQAALRILPGTSYHALGVDIDAGTEEIARAHRDLEARFGPAALAPYDLGDLGDLARSVQDRVAAAHRVLGDEGRRRQYLAFLLLGLELSGARRPGIVPDAEIALKRGERALRARRPGEAIPALRAAVALAPHEPEYLALLSLAELHDPAAPAPARAAAALATASRALALDPDHLRARAVLALAAARAGRPELVREASAEANRRHPGSALARGLRRLAGAA